MYVRKEFFEPKIVAAPFSFRQKYLTLQQSQDLFLDKLSNNHLDSIVSIMVKKKGRSEFSY